MLPSFSEHTKKFIFPGSIPLTTSGLCEIDVKTDLNSKFQLLRFFFPLCGSIFTGVRLYKFKMLYKSKCEANRGQLTSQYYNGIYSGITSWDPAFSQQQCGKPAQQLTFPQAPQQYHQNPLITKLLLKTSLLNEKISINGRISMWQSLILFNSFYTPQPPTQKHTQARCNVIDRKCSQCHHNYTKQQIMFCWKKLVTKQEVKQPSSITALCPREITCTHMKGRDVITHTKCA